MNVHFWFWLVFIDSQNAQPLDVTVLDVQDVGQKDN